MEDYRMFKIEFDPEAAIDITLDWLEDATNEISDELIIGVANFFYELSNGLEKINSYFE
jgi:hypothetical protein